MERATAKKCSIHDLATGRYVVKDGTQPNYVETVRGPIVRVNLIAAVVGKNNKSLVLDDGTSHIEARAFDDDRLFQKSALGSFVLLIGRPREYQGQRYVAAEICKALVSPKWLELRQTELKRFEVDGEELQPTQKSPKQSLPDMKQTITTKKTIQLEENNNLTKKNGEKKDEINKLTADALLTIIRSLDDGQGAPVEKVLVKAGRADAETMLTNLLAEGEIFEIRAGKVKVLE